VSSFVIATTTANFTDRRRGSMQVAGDLEKLTLGITVTNATDWTTLESLVTTKYHLHIPLSGNTILDIVRGLGVGTLTITGLGSASAILTSLKRDTYLKGTTTQGLAEFLVTTAWTGLVM